MAKQVGPSDDRGDSMEEGGSGGGGDYSSVRYASNTPSRSEGGEGKPSKERPEKASPKDGGRALENKGEGGSASSGGGGKSSDSKPKEPTREEKNKAEVDELLKKLTDASNQIGEGLKKGAEQTKTAGDDYTKKLEGLVGETQKLSKWHEGLVTSYQGIADRYRKEFELAEKQREKEQQQAQRDYGANAALMSKAAAVGMGAAGPMTGAQQQLMMASAQQQATNAYSSAQDRMAAMEMQRKQLGAQVVQASMNQELSNRQAGYTMDAGSIQARAGMYGHQYGAALTGIDAMTNANIYGGQAAMGIANAGAQQSLALRGLGISQDTANAQIAAANNMPQVQGPSVVGTGIMRGLAGAGTGFAVGGPVGAAVGGLLGFGSALFG